MQQFGVEQKQETRRKSESTANPFRSIEGKMTPLNRRLIQNVIAQSRIHWAGTRFISSRFEFCATVVNRKMPFVFALQFVMI